MKDTDETAARGVEASGQSDPTGNAAAADRRWTPSKRCRQLIGAMWDAFEAGDKWVYVTHANTARISGETLVWRGAAEMDPNNRRRFRLPSEVLEANGYPGRDWQSYVRDLREMEAEEEATA